MDFFNTLLVGKTMRSVRLVGNFGLGILSDPTHIGRQNDVIVYGLSVALAMTSATELVADINGIANTRRRDPPSRDRHVWGFSSRRALHTWVGSV